MDTLDEITGQAVLDHGAAFTVDDRCEVLVEMLGERLARVRIAPRGGVPVRRTWSITPGPDVEAATGLHPQCLLQHAPDVPWEGRDRDGIGGLPLVPVTVEAVDDAPFDVPERDETSAAAADEADLLDVPAAAERHVAITTASVRVDVRDRPFRLEWSVRRGAEWVTLAEDRRTGAYELGPVTGRLAHHRHRAPTDHYYGLGDRAGDLERTGGVYELRCLDALGYDATSTDPLYKHIPFLMTRREGVGAFGTFYDNQSAGRFDLGRSIDNYHRPHATWTAEGGDFDCWVFLEPTLARLTGDILQLTGDPAFPPRWSLGYSASTMHYTDAPDAQSQMAGFLRHLAEHEIPCDSFQLSSGYTSIGPRRYVFTWNRSKFPEPRRLADLFHAHGIRLAANVKPALLRDHPLYEQARSAGVFVRVGDDPGRPAMARFWGGEAAHVDFTSPAGVRWWTSHVTTQLLDQGIDATWNDNNEFEVWDEQAICDGSGAPAPLARIRPTQALLMCRASHEAQTSFSPANRPFLITRSGPLGLQRYAQTWSGDNATSWTTLKYNTRMGVGMSMSGLVNFGHDVGGFAGAGRPDPELFVRWVQNGALHPRFTIHSWHDDGSVNEPWMHPEVTPLVRDAIRLRYRLLPHLYTLLYRAAERREPLVRPTFFLDEDDDTLYIENDDFCLGEDLLVASVVEPGQRTRPVRLPRVPGGWFEFDTGRHHEGGVEVTLAAPLDRLPLLVRAGAGIVTCALPEVGGGGIVSTDTLASATRVIVLYLTDGESRSAGFLFDDDGTTYGYRDGDGLWLHWVAMATTNAVHVTWSREGRFAAAWSEPTFRLRPTDTRPLTVTRA